MAVYVDNYRAKFRRMIMCHMIADTLPELHEMAQKIGMKSSWFQPKSFPHYDVCLSRRKAAVELGAIEVTPQELVSNIRRIRAAKSALNTDGESGIVGA